MKPFPSKIDFSTFIFHWYDHIRPIRMSHPMLIRAVARWQHFALHSCTLLGQEWDPRSAANQYIYHPPLAHPLVAHPHRPRKQRYLSKYFEVYILSLIVAWAVVLVPLSSPGNIIVNRRGQVRSQDQRWDELLMSLHLLFVSPHHSVLRLRL